MDVIILGGGVAGLSAYRELLKKDSTLRVLLIEARHELGGRLRSFEGEWRHHDAGAAWIHGVSHRNPVVAEARRCGVDLVEVCDTNPWCDPDAWRRAATVWRRGGRKMEDAELEDAARRWKSALRTACIEADENDPDVPLDLPMSMHAELMVLWMGASLDCLQLREFSESGGYGDHPGPHALPVGGMKRVFADLLHDDRFEVKLGTRVNLVQVTPDEDLVRLRYSNDGVATARAVIVTIPLGVLKDQSLLFDPPLPIEKRIAIDRLGVGAYAKVLLKWNTPPWWVSEKPFMACIDDNDDEEDCMVFVDHFEVSGDPILEVAVAGHRAEIFDAIDHEACVEKVLSRLRCTFGEDEVPNPVDSRVTRWSQDEYTKGAYSYWRLGSSETDVDSLAQPVDDKIFFAGEATSVEYQGSLAGAMETGIRAARDVLRYHSSNSRKTKITS